MILRWLVLLSLAFSVLSAEENPYTVAVVRAGPSRFDAELLAQTEMELKELLDDKIAYVFLEDPSFNANWKPELFPMVLESAFNNPDVDAVLTLNLAIAEIAARSPEPLPKPVIASFIPKDELFARKYSENERSLVPNLTFTVIPGGFLSDLVAFQKLGDFKTIHLFTDQTWLDANPHIYSIAEAKGLNLEIVSTKGRFQDILSKLNRPLEAVYLTPFEQLSDQEYQQIISTLNEKQIPTFSMLGYPDLDRGVLAAGNQDLIPLLARRSALNIQQIALGDKPENLYTDLPLEGQLRYSERTANSIEFSPSFEAMLAFERVEPLLFQEGAPLSLDEAMCLTLFHSHELSAAHAESAAYCNQKGLYLSAMRPQLHGKSLYYRIDTQRAEHFMGLIPKERTSAGVHVGQMIYDDGLISAYRSACRVYQSAKWNERDTLLDTVLRGGECFLEYWAAVSLLNIERENFKLIQKNLATARLREKIGSGGPADVYRWESEEAQRRSVIFERESKAMMAKTVLNQCLGYCQDQEWLPIEITAQEIDQLFLGDIVHRLSSSGELKGKFEQFSVETALKNNPKLHAIENLISSKQIQWGQASRERISPKVYANFDYDRQLQHSNIQGVINSKDVKNNWMALLTVSVPLYEGGAHCHKVNLARSEIVKLNEEKRNVCESIQTAVLSSIYALQSSYPRIWLTRIAADRAMKNLQLVEHNYAAGTVNIVDLLDAEAQQRIQEQNASLAVIQYFKDLLVYQRAIAWFEFLNDGIQKEEWYRRWETFSCRY